MEGEEFLLIICLFLQIVCIDQKDSLLLSKLLEKTADFTSFKKTNLKEVNRAN